VSPLTLCQMRKLYGKEVPENHDEFSELKYLMRRELEKNGKRWVLGHLDQLRAQWEFILSF
jgi:hypothetical protein